MDSNVLVVETEGVTPQVSDFLNSNRPGGQNINLLKLGFSTAIVNTVIGTVTPKEANVATPLILGKPGTNL